MSTAEPEATEATPTRGVTQAIRETLEAGDTVDPEAIITELGTTKANVHASIHYLRSTQGMDILTVPREGQMAGYRLRTTGPDGRPLTPKHRVKQALLKGARLDPLQAGTVYGFSHRSTFDNALKELRQEGHALVSEPGKRGKAGRPRTVWWVDDAAAPEPEPVTVPPASTRAQVTAEWTRQQAAKGWVFGADGTPEHPPTQSMTPSVTPHLGSTLTVAGLFLDEEGNVRLALRNGQSSYVVLLVSTADRV
jgi:biotin operon repressor